MPINSSIDFSDFIKTMKECSCDDCNNEFMVEDDMEVISFDDVKNKYMKQNKGLFSDRLTSNDVLIEKNGKWYFIEFKNGNILKKDKKDIFIKIYDSVIIFQDIMNKDIDFCRENMVYVLIYNETRNDNDKREVLEQTEINVSQNRNIIGARLSGLAHRPWDAMFGLKKFKNFIFKEVYTVPKCDYEKFMREYVL